jgi:hypothetical protein
MSNPPANYDLIFGEIGEIFTSDGEVREKLLINNKYYNPERYFIEIGNSLDTNKYEVFKDWLGYNRHSIKYNSRATKLYFLIEWELYKSRGMN